jgi:hypothetical protein
MVSGVQDPSPTALDAVLFDFHGKLATTIDPIAWVKAAAARCGIALDHGRATVLADRIATAGGLPGVAKPARIPPHLAEAWADRDLYERAHRDAYIGLAATVCGDIPGLAEAIYEHVLTPVLAGVPRRGTAVKHPLRRGVKVAVVSNIGFDMAATRRVGPDRAPRRGGALARVRLREAR